MAEERTKLKVGITMGDPGGVGVETVIKIFHDGRIMEDIIPILYGNSEVVKIHRKAGELPDFKHHNIKTAEEAKAKSLNVLDVLGKSGDIEIGAANKEQGEMAFKALEAAVADLAATKIDVLVTAPINKDTIQNEDFKFPGHTEYLASMSNVEEHLMFLVSDRMRIGVVTGHIPIKDVANAITPEAILSKLRIMNESLLKDFGVPSPRIAVLGLNPHAGDNGLLGEEEKTVIIPAIRDAQSNGLKVYGPYGADGFFGTGQYKNFDAVLAMYHDQGLAPFKALAFEDGVNFTAGLPIVRTSPDHGTAYDIAGKGVADEGSMRQAIFMACDIHRNREAYKSYSSNPLQIQKRPQKKRG